jgi:hypothetical protein
LLSLDDFFIHSQSVSMAQRRERRLVPAAVVRRYLADQTAPLLKPHNTISTQPIGFACSAPSAAARQPSLPRIFKTEDMPSRRDRARRLRPRNSIKPWRRGWRSRRTRYTRDKLSRVHQAFDEVNQRPPFRSSRRRRQQARSWPTRSSRHFVYTSVCNAPPWFMTQATLAHTLDAVETVCGPPDLNAIL